MHKKSIIFICFLIFLILFGISSIYDEPEVILSGSNKSVMNSNTLTMMYETDYQSGEYQVSSDITWPESGYTFNENLSKCENGSKLAWDDENKKVLLQANVSDKCYVYFDISPTFVEYIISYVYTGTDGENGLYYHDGVGSYTNADQEAGDNSYRYSGANPNNYVCFGSNEEVCPADNIYRVIGVFENKVKLIKNSSIGDFRWGSAVKDDSENEEVSNSKKNNYDLLPLVDWYPEVTQPEYTNSWLEARVNNYVNNDFFNQLDDIWKKLIIEHVWEVGGITSNQINITPKSMYEFEVVSNSVGTEVNEKMGLMYISDYGYAASPENWDVGLENYNNNISYNNWMFLGISEWTIVPCSSDSSDVFYISSNGDLEYTNAGIIHAVRPTFYLNLDVKYISGTGTQTDPYRIA